MNQITRSALRVRHETRLRLAQVVRVEAISPRMRRIVLGGEALDGFVTAAPDDHVKLFFPTPGPAPGQERPVLPTRGADGLVWPEGATRPAVRDYTPRRYDPQARELTLEFVLHGDGPAASWAAAARPGCWLGVGGPRGSHLLPDDHAAYLLAGDETALPAIARTLEALRPGVPATVLLEVADRREERHLPTAASAAVTWLHRDAPRRCGTARRSDAAGQGDAGEGEAPGLLARALLALPAPHPDTYAWLAGEIEAMRALRRHLVEERGLARAQVRAAGYWRRGTAGAHERLDD